MMSATSGAASVAGVFFPPPQTRAPTTAYRGGPNGTTALELPFLAYYTANGNMPYRDGKRSACI